MPLAKEGVKGFKCFLIESGVDEFPCVNEEEVLKAMPKLAVRLDRLSLVLPWPAHLPHPRNRKPTPSSSSTPS